MVSRRNILKFISNLFDVFFCLLESKQARPEDEVYFSASNASSPRLVN